MPAANYSGLTPEQAKEISRRLSAAEKWAARNEALYARAGKIPADLIDRLSVPADQAMQDWAKGNGPSRPSGPAMDPIHLPASPLGNEDEDVPGTPVTLRSSGGVAQNWNEDEDVSAPPPSPGGRLIDHLSQQLGGYSGATNSYPSPQAPAANPPQFSHDQMVKKLVENGMSMQDAVAAVAKKYPAQPPVAQPQAPTPSGQAPLAPLPPPVAAAPQPAPSAQRPVSGPPQAPPSSPSAQARALMADLNARRRAAGGEVPGAAGVEAEIRSLLSQANGTPVGQQATAGQSNGPPTDPQPQIDRSKPGPHAWGGAPAQGNWGAVPGDPPPQRQGAPATPIEDNSSIVQRGLERARDLKALANRPGQTREQRTRAIEQAMIQVEINHYMTTTGASQAEAASMVHLPSIKDAALKQEVSDSVKEGIDSARVRAADEQRQSRTATGQQASEMSLDDAVTQRINQMNTYARSDASGGLGGQNRLRDAEDPQTRAMIADQIRKEEKAAQAQEIADTGLGTRRVPSPRGAGGERSRPGSSFSSGQDAESYNERVPNLPTEVDRKQSPDVATIQRQKETLPDRPLGQFGVDPLRFLAPRPGQQPKPVEESEPQSSPMEQGGLPAGGKPGLYKPSQKDRDEQLRGRVPVYGPHGEISYAVAAPDSPDGGAPGAAGRAGHRPDLEKAGYEVEQRMGPTGMQTVYVPGSRMVQTLAANKQSDLIERLRARAGISPKDLATLSDEVGSGERLIERLRQEGNQTRSNAASARNTKRANQAELAGQNPAKNAANAFGRLSPEQQQEVLIKRLSSGGHNNDPAMIGLEDRRMQHAERMKLLERSTLAQEKEQADKGSAIKHAADLADEDQKRAKLKEASAAHKTTPNVIDQLQQGNYADPETRAFLAKVAADEDQTWLGSYSQDDIDRIAGKMRSIGVQDPEGAAQEALKARHERSFTDWNDPATAGKSPR